jgi:molybdenum cofactor cytidylyltransferase
VPAEPGIAAVVLAAGASRRFGAANKLLASIDGRTLVERVVDALFAGGVDEIVVVTGCDRAAVEAALAGREVRFADNPRWETGMGSSIAAGIAALGRDAPGAFVVPGDLALLSPQLVAQLVAAFAAAGGRRIVFPTNTAGEQRNPVAWPRRYFAALCALPPGAGAKSLLIEARAEWLPVPVKRDAELGDVDTPGDLEAARANTSTSRT